MRHDIYYWKCDSSHSLDERRQSFFKEKCEQPHLAEAVREACANVFGRQPDRLEPLRVDGNHVTFRFEVDGQSYLFRGDAGTGDDDYMLWKTKIRHGLGYFDKAGDFFLNATDEGDALFIGHSNLALNLGCPGDWDASALLAAEQRVLQACVRHGKTAGMLLKSEMTVAACRAKGFPSSHWAPTSAA